MSNFDQHKQDLENLLAERFLKLRRHHKKLSLRAIDRASTAALNKFMRNTFGRSWREREDALAFYDIAMGMSVAMDSVQEYLESRGGA